MQKLFVKGHKYLTESQLKHLLSEKEQMLLYVKSGEEIKLATGGNIYFEQDEETEQIKALYPIIKPLQLGDKEFTKTYGTQYAYYAGAMANGISSVQMVIELGKKGFMGSLGTGGMNLQRIEADIDKVQSELKNEAYLINLLSSPSMLDIEMKTVELFLRKNVRAIEASAFIELSKALVYYRVAGFELGEDGRAKARNHVIAKVSREEVAAKFMSPAPINIVKILLAENKITELQAELAGQMPMADDITVEADSGGHTDQRPLVSLFPAITLLNDQMQEKYRYATKIRIGAGGGIGTPASALAAFQMGAAYVITGSINQSCIEAGTSDQVKKVLADVHMQDVVMAPCADMFELGAKVQVIKKGTMFPMNAQKLYQIYNDYKGISDIPQSKKEAIEKRMFHDTLENIWEQTEKYFMDVDPQQVTRANKNEKYKMALVFRWYLGQSSKWSIKGDADRIMDMQIWCGQSMGAFNNLVRGTKYEKPESRKVAEVAELIMYGAAYLINVQNAIVQGVKIETGKEYLI